MQETTKQKQITTKKHSQRVFDTPQRNTDVSARCMGDLGKVGVGRAHFPTCGGESGVGRENKRYKNTYRI